MSTHRVLLLSASICAAIAPACGGRSGLDDFSNGANNIIVSPGGGDDRDPSDAGAGGADDGDAGNGDSDGGSSGDPDDKPSNGGKLEIGQKCERDKQCKDEGATCLTEIEIFGDLGLEFPGGYCSVRECEDDGDCPDGSGCLNLFGMGTCAQLCEDDDACRTDEGYQCASLRGGGPGGGGMDRPSYCLPPFGGGGGQPGQGGGGFGGN